MTTAPARPALLLPGPDGATRHVLAAPRTWPRPNRPFRSRVAYAAAHVVPRPLSDTSPGAPARLDWDATLGLRHELWSYGLGVAEAMDTAQRGMGLDWPAARELITRSAAEAAAVRGAIAAGAGTDHLDPDALLPGRAGLRQVLGAYREQVEHVAGTGATVILMASRALARVARTPDDYAAVYGPLLDELDRPAILHWLGAMFDPQLAGYWGSTDVEEATDGFVALIAAHARAVDGVKVSLLDAAHEVRLRARLPRGVRLYTGDDVDYPDLIVGDDVTGHSDALLGIFAAIHPAASAALQALDAGDRVGAHALLAATAPLGRHVFEAPTYLYKTGIAFLSWLNGRQAAFSMVGGLHAGRSVPHLVELFRLADGAGLLSDPERAADRMRTFLAVHGFSA